MLFLHLTPFHIRSRKNDASFENPFKMLLESRKTLSMASSRLWPCPQNWKSTTFSKIDILALKEKNFLPSFQGSISHEPLNLSGWKTHSKNFKTPFFSRYQKILPWGNSNGSKTSPNFFLKKYLNKYGR